MTLLGGTHPRPPAAGHVRHRFTRRHTLRQRSFVRLGAALFAASLALTACGDRSDDDGGDAGITGVVGTLNSSVAQSVQPVLDSASILMVSPANTNPTLTQGADPASPARPY